MKQKSAWPNLASCLPRLWQSVVRGFDTVDHVLRRGALAGRESTLRKPLGETPVGVNRGQLTLLQVTAIVMVCGPLYGFAMGSYACLVGERTLIEQIPQMVYSAIKVPLLITVTLIVSIPSFYVINTLLGLRDDFGEAWRSIISAQAGLTIILSSLFPVTLFVYLSLTNSTASYQAAVLINAGMFGLASVAAQLLLRGYYRALVKKDARHRWMIRFWIFVYAFVGIQAAYVLRPFIGNPNQSTTFFRRESFQNAYVKVFELVWNIVGRLFE